MTDEYRGHDRRSEDTRLTVLERDISAILKAQESTIAKLDRVSDTLHAIQSEPEQFPAGRALLRRAERNSARLDKHDQEIEALEGWRSEWLGMWRFVLGLGTVLGVVGSFFGILAFFGLAR